jgi:uncharacterized membrane protein HdeD (DUF308 family)
MLFGMILILHPMAATIGLAMLLGILLFIGGLAHIAFSFMAKKWVGFLFMVLLGLVYLAASLFLLANPIGGVITLTLLLGAFLMVGGCIKIAMSQALHAWANSGWLMFDGFLSILLGVLVIMAWPADSLWVMGLLFGINLLFGGITFLLLGMAEKNA